MVVRILPGRPVVREARMDVGAAALQPLGGGWLPHPAVRPSRLDRRTSRWLLGGSRRAARWLEQLLRRQRAAWAGGHGTKSHRSLRQLPTRRRGAAARSARRWQRRERARTMRVEGTPRPPTPRKAPALHAHERGWHMCCAWMSHTLALHAPPSRLPGTGMVLDVCPQHA